jgi:hypothetical protein
LSSPVSRTRSLAAAAFATCALAGAARADLPRVAEPDRWSAGFVLGAPTGLTVKRYLGGPNAFDVGFGFALGPGLRVWGDYLFGLAQLPSDSSSVGLDLFLGAGPMLGTFRGSCGVIASDRCGGGEVYAGVRIPFGVEAVFRRTPLAVGIELAPGIAVSSGGAGGTFDLALTARLLL